MSFTTVARLTRHLSGAADLLRSKMDVAAQLHIISGILLLKWASDQPDILQVPDHARWSYIFASEGKTMGRIVNEALQGLERSNPKVLGGVLDEAIDLSKRLGATTIKDLVDHFDRMSLRDANLEFGDVVGRAYDCLLESFVDRARKLPSEFYTPRSVARLMVRLVRPEGTQSVYDPFAGSAGMLTQAKEYVDEKGGEGAGLALFGQERNVSTWSIARLNLVLHGVANSSLLCGDALPDPLHMFVDERRALFDRVVTNPPFSTNYVEKEVRFPERMRYGWTPEHGKRAELMNVQHVLAMLRPDGVGAVVTPYGVLFRGGAEAGIRKGIVEDGRLEAIIGIGPNVFHGTAVPACIMVLRGEHGSSEGRQGQVLFINAEREIVTGRTQNLLQPQHVEKIVQTFRNWADVPYFSRVVSLTEIAENDFDLNIRRYVNANPPTQPSLDIRAAIFGGVPRAEVDAETTRFQRFGLDPVGLFRATDTNYLDFSAEGRHSEAEHIREVADFVGQEYLERCRQWWQTTAARVAELAGTNWLSMFRPNIAASFIENLLSPGILDSDQLSGVFAAWWHDHRDDLRSLDRRGFLGVFERWTTDDGNRGRQVPADYAREHVLSALGDDLCSGVERLISTERQALVNTYYSWEERYATSLVDLEDKRDCAAARLRSRLAALGYD